MADNQSKEKQDIAARAKKRFEEGTAFEQDFRSKYDEDMNFYMADSDNQDQWPDAVKTARQAEQRPMLTINKVQTHVNHVVNEMRENRPRISVHPTNTQANYEAAEVFDGMIRHIENASNAEEIYENAMLTLTAGGVGYWRINTQYESENTFDQVVRIDPIPDPLTVVIDPYCRKADCSDAGWAVLYEDMPRDRFDSEFPGEADSIRDDDFSNQRLTDGMIRVMEFFERDIGTEWLYELQSETGPVCFRKSRNGAEAVKIAHDAWEASRELDDGQARRRKVTVDTISWYKIANGRVIESTTWAGKYIPIVRVTAIERVKDGKLDRKGLVRFMKDAQRMYNYNASAAVEFGALQSKTPYVGPVEAFDGLENYWRDANTKNHAYLPYNGLDDTGNPIASPQRQNPPTAAPVFAQGMQDAERQMMMSSGQYESTFSEQANEVSGKAILERKSQGNRATFHFLERTAIGIAYTGKILIDLIPKIYDTQRVVRIIGEDGSEEQQITIDPQAQAAVAKQQENNADNEVQTVFNPAVGEYDVISVVGPNYQTRRENAFDAMTQVLGGNGQLMQVFGDLWMSQADFPMANKLAERLRNWIPSNILNGGPSPQEQELQQQNQQLMQQVQALSQQLTEKMSALKLEKQRIDMDYLNHAALRVDNDQEQRTAAYKAETDRLKAVGPAMTPEVLAPIITNLLVEIMNGPEISEPKGYAPPDAAQVIGSGADQILDNQAPDSQNI
jgi:hypothetical protein